MNTRETVPATRTCRLVTLGCKVNQYETQYVREMLEHAGYVAAAEGQPADLCVVNTCTVTGEGDAKGRQLVRRLHHENPDASIVVMGCYATRDPSTVRQLPGVSAVVTDKARLVEDLQPYGVTSALPGISRFDDHQRAFVKVQDGCLLNCSYCIIPSVRPTVRSRPIKEIEAEVERLVAAGYHEMVLTGIHLGHYGIDLSRGRLKAEWTRLWHLLERLTQLPGDFRVRLSSLEAAEARDDLVRVLADQPRICPHLHLCLQSGSDRILARMKRRYRAGGFLERCRRIRAALDNPAFTTDVIVGFPGETDADFEATCRVVREVGFTKVHIFSYSPRQGTPAATWNEAVPPEVIRERRQRLQEIDRELGNAYARSLLGRQLDVLVESADPKRPGFVRGTACRAVTVSLRGHLPALIRQCVPVRAVDVVDGVVLGEPEPEVDPALLLARAQRRLPLPLTVAGIW
jgi:threonylcarbamoyladenosine tRNA methylthiotransferase MtaB